MSKAMALELRDVHKRFGRTEVIRGVSLSVLAGERVALIGPNGAGKSTLFNLMSGSLSPDQGDVLLQGRSIAGRKPHEINRMGLARSFQISNVFPRLSVRDNLRCSALWSLGTGYALFRWLHRCTEANQRADLLMEQLGLSAQAGVPAQQLSYAEQRALELGMTVAGNAPVILLDEPTAGMSQSETVRITGLIRSLTEGKTLVTVEHDMGVVFDLADRIAVLVQGQVLAFDTPDAIRANPLVQQAYLGNLQPSMAEGAR